MIYLAVGVVTIRMLLPWNFHFAANVESHKILPKYQKRFLIFLCHREGLTDEVNDDSEQVYRNIKQVLNNFQSKK